MKNQKPEFPQTKFRKEPMMDKKNIVDSLLDPNPNPNETADFMAAVVQALEGSDPAAAAAPTMKDVKAEVYADSYSVRSGVFTLRWGFFYRHGKDAQTHVDKVLAAFPHALVLDSGEEWKPFNGGASVRNSSHWWVKFTFVD